MIKSDAPECFKWYPVNERIPEPYVYLILGRWLKDRCGMVWQIGRYMPDTGFEFYNIDERSGPYCNDSFWDFKASDTTHWMEIAEPDCDDYGNLEGIVPPKRGPFWEEDDKKCLDAMAPLNGVNDDLLSKPNGSLEDDGPWLTIEDMPADFKKAFDEALFKTPVSEQVAAALRSPDKTDRTKGCVIKMRRYEEKK